MGEIEDERAGPTVSELIDRFEAEHLPRCPSTIHNCDFTESPRFIPAIARVRRRDHEVGIFAGARTSYAGRQGKRGISRTTSWNAA